MPCVSGSSKSTSHTFEFMYRQFGDTDVVELLSQMFGGIVADSGTTLMSHAATPQADLPGRWFKTHVYPVKAI